MPWRARRRRPVPPPRRARQAACRDGHDQRARPRHRARRRASLPRAPMARYRVQATEGGHIDFAPLDQIEDAILARLRKRHTPRLGRARRLRARHRRHLRRRSPRWRAARSSERGRRRDLDRGHGAARTASPPPRSTASACRSAASRATIALAQGGLRGVVIAGGLGYRLRETCRTRALPNASAPRAASQD